MKKKTVSLFVAATLVAGNIATPVYGATPTADNGLLTKLDEALSAGDVITVDGIADENTTADKEVLTKEDVESEQKFADDQVVNIIVELDDDSLLQKYVDEGASVDFEEYYAEDKSKDVLDELAAKRDEVKEKLDKEVSDYAVICDYDTVINGFAISVEYGNLEKIESIPGVKRAFVSATYELDKTDVSEATPNMAYSKEMIGSTEENSLSYAGAGTVVAILDTGLDYEHEAFSTNFPENGKYSKEDIASVIDSSTLASETFAGKELSADDLYVNSKVIYGYDYADNDTMIIPDNAEQNHGTHVAGTIAGNCDNLKGVAKDAQLMIMKVFSDKGGGASDTNILAGLDDAVALGADVINMSLGSSAGFTSTEEQAVSDVYDLVTASGINLSVSAGNSYSSSYNSNYGNYALATNPDNGIVGSPSTYPGSLSVASIENTHLANCAYFLGGKDDVTVEAFYNDNGPDDKKLSTLTGTYEFVDCGTGSEEEIAAVDVSGKVALIKRGSIAFSDKVANAAKAGAIAVIIYNNTSGTISMSVENYYVPAVSITQASGEALLALTDKVVTFGSDLVKDAPNGQAYQMSDFSSLGVTPDLKLKPEVTAPGGNIYSATIGGGYVNMSGTSMAAPHVSGAMAIVKGYVNEKYPELSKVEKENLINSLLMSTATPVVDSNGQYYTPRKTGSGLINTEKAITTKAYLSVDNNDRPKAELGYNTDGAYEFSFNVNNLSSEELTYKIDTTVLMENLSSYNGNIVFTMSSSSLGEDATVTYENVNDGVVTVPANGSTTVKVNFAISDDAKAFYDEHCTNGLFVDGYVQLLASDETNSDLTLPFMGFYGDWAKAPMFDAAKSADSTEVMKACTLYDVNCKYLLGQNMFGEGGVENNKYVIAPKATMTKEDGTPYFAEASTITGLLRNAEKLTYTVTNEAGEVVDEFAYDYVRKSYYYASGSMMLSAEDLMDEPPVFNGKDKDGNYLPQGMYTITITGVVCGTNGATQSMTENVYLDFEAPQVDDTVLVKQDGKDYLLVSVEDNHYVAGVQLTTVDGKVAVTKTKAISEDTIGSTTVLTYDITGLSELLANNGYESDKVAVSVVDYGLNASSKVVSIAPKYKVSFKKFVVAAKEGTTTTQVADVKSLNSIGYTPEVTYSSTNEKVATVDANGVVTAKKPGTTTIVAQLPDGTKGCYRLVVTVDVKKVFKKIFGWIGL